MDHAVAGRLGGLVHWVVTAASPAPENTVTLCLHVYVALSLLGTIRLHHMLSPSAITELCQHFQRLPCNVVKCKQTAAGLSPLAPRNHLGAPSGCWPSVWTLCWSTSPAQQPHSSARCSLVAAGRPQRTPAQRLGPLSAGAC